MDSLTKYGITSCNLLSAALAIVSTSCTLLLLLLIYKEYKHVKLLSKFYTYKCQSIWGSFIDFPPTHDGITKVREVILQHPEEKFMIFRTILWVHTVIVSHPDAMMELLLLNATDAPKEPFVYQLLLPYLGEGLLVANNPKWRKRRRMLTPAFHFDILKPYASLFNESAEMLINKWTAQLESSISTIEVFSEASQVTLDVMLKCVCCFSGYQEGELDLTAYISAIHTANKLFMKQIVNVIYLIRPIFHISPDGFKWRKVCKLILKCSLKIIQARRRSLLEENKDSQFKTGKRKDFIDILLTATDASGRRLTDQDIIDEMNTFLFEGHDTTASAVAWTLFLLAKHPDCQSKCREEIQNVLKERTVKTIEWDDVQKFKYTIMCAKESQRMFPPVPSINRRLNRDVNIFGHTIPKGTWVLLAIDICQRHPLFWDKSSEFIPSRFESEMPGGHPFAYVPFSGGARNCIGQRFAFTEIIVLLARILNRFILEPVTTEVKLLPSITLKAEGQVFIKLRNV